MYCPDSRCAPISGQYFFYFAFKTEEIHQIGLFRGDVYPYMKRLTQILVQFPTKEKYYFRKFIQILNKPLPNVSKGYIIIYNISRNLV